MIYVGSKVKLRPYISGKEDRKQVDWFDGVDRNGNYVMYRAIDTNVKKDGKRCFGNYFIKLRSLDEVLPVGTRIKITEIKNIECTQNGIYLNVQVEVGYEVVSEVEDDEEEE